jgi:hypothetical protein
MTGYQEHRPSAKAKSFLVLGGKSYTNGSPGMAITEDLAITHPVTKGEWIQSTNSTLHCLSSSLAEKKRIIYSIRIVASIWY